MFCKVSKGFLPINFLFFFLASFSFAQDLEKDGVPFSIIKYPQVIDPQGRHNYTIKVEMEKGAERDWDLGVDNVVNHLVLDQLRLVGDTAAFKLDIKIFRQTGMEAPVAVPAEKAYKFKGSLPVSAKLTDAKGNVLYSFNKNNYFCFYDFSESSAEAIRKLFLERRDLLLDNIRRAVADLIDYENYNFNNRLSFYYVKDVFPYREFHFMQLKANKELFNKFFAPGQVLVLPKTRLLVDFWKKKYATTSADDKQFKRVKFFTAFNLAVLYGSNGNIDSAEHWFKLAKEENSNFETSRLKDFIEFEKENLKRYLALSERDKKTVYDPAIHTRNYGFGNIDFQPKEEDRIFKPLTSNITGDIYKGGVQTEGEFVPVTGKPFDPAMMRFLAKGATAIKLITPFSADSVVIGNDRYFPADGKMAKLHYENAELRILRYVPITGTEDAFNSIYHFYRKSKKQLSSFYTGQGKFSKFVSKAFGDCPLIVENVNKGVYDKGPTKDLSIQLAKDFLQSCK